MKTIKITTLLIAIFSFGVSFSQKYGYVNEQNVFVIEPKFVAAREFKEGLAAVQFTDKKGLTRWRFINENGDFTTEVKYWSVNDFNDGFTTVEYGIGYWGIINASEKIMTSLAADFMSPVVEGMVLYRKKDKVGFLNTEGKNVVKPIYERAELFSNGFALVQLKGLYGFIDKSGKVVIPIKYTAVKSFSNNKFKVNLANAYFEIDLAGKETKISKEDFDKKPNNEESNNLKKPDKNLKKLKVAQERKAASNSQMSSNNNSQSNGNISTSSYALDIFSELGSMVIYKGSTMYVVKVKGKKMQDQSIVAARANQVLGFTTESKYQWFSGNNCTTIKSKYGGTFTVICQGEIDLDK
jgi:hypothetical protein